MRRLAVAAGALAFLAACQPAAHPSSEQAPDLGRVYSRSEVDMPPARRTAWSRTHLWARVSESWH